MIKERIKSIKYTEFKTNLRPEELYSNFVDHKYSALLTGQGKKDNSKYSFIGLNPFYIHITNKDPFKELQELIDFYSVKKYKYPMNLWGCIGYLSYEAVHKIEKIPKTTKNSYKLPLMQLVFYKDMIVYDHHKKKNYLIQIKQSKEDYTNIEDILVNSKKVYKFESESDLMFCSKKFYTEKVNKIKHYIIDGDVYEVNLSHQFNIKFTGETYGIFEKLYSLNPAPFSAYLPFGDQTIISNSPERFILAEKNKIETRPIKGTLPRKKSKSVLKKSVKDTAELSMIVDLMRNDFGKVCEYGSVKVKEHKRIEGYKSVWQMLSIIVGKLRKDENYGSLLKACFPGGSITGCPKIRSMEIIDELEDYTRNLYTGSIFIANNQRMDSNIVIRTIVADKDNLYFNAGGAIVYDSIPEKEYQETLDKARNIMKVLGL